MVMERNTADREPEGHSAKPLSAVLWAGPHGGGVTLPCRSLCCDEGVQWARSISERPERHIGGTLTDALHINDSLRSK